jgi:hypothetical protein
MQVISGALYRDKHTIVELPARKILANGWGEIGQRHITGNPIKPVPERFTVAWFSYAEDQFFAGTVDLPHATIAELFRDGFEQPVPGDRVTWDKIMVGMGLGGWTSVWLAGSGVVREVNRARVEPAEIDWVHVLDNPAIRRVDYVRSKLQSRLDDATLARLIEHGPPVSTWTRYSQRYQWRIVVGGLHTPLDMFLRTFNGERSYYDFAKHPPQALHIAPKHLQNTWRTRAGSRLLTRIRLDEEEVFGAFDRAASATSRSATTTLRVEFTAHTEVEVSVESGAVRIPLTRSHVEVGTLAW